MKKRGDSRGPCTAQPVSPPFPARRRARSHLPRLRRRPRPISFSPASTHSSGRSSPPSSPSPAPLPPCSQPDFQSICHCRPLPPAPRLPSSSLPSSQHSDHSPKPACNFSAAIWHCQHLLFFPNASELKFPSQHISSFRRPQSPLLHLRPVSAAARRLRPLISSTVPISASSHGSLLQSASPTSSSSARLQCMIHRTHRLPSSPSPSQSTAPRHCQQSPAPVISSAAPTSHPPSSPASPLPFPAGLRQISHHFTAPLPPALPSPPSSTSSDHHSTTASVAGCPISAAPPQPTAATRSAMAGSPSLQPMDSPI